MDMFAQCSVPPGKAMLPILPVKRPFLDLVVCIGGDGTMNEVMSGLLDSGVDLPIGYIPAGSTNDFAASLGLSKDVLTAAKDIIEGTPKRLDVGSFNGRRFSYVASFGAFTEAQLQHPPKAPKTCWGIWPMCWRA